MKKNLFIILLLLSSKFSFSQKVDVNKHWLNNMNRTEITEPNYELKKIKSLIEVNNRGYGRNNILAETIYHSLTLREKFTYNMIHAESFSQNCGEPFVSVPDAAKKIFARLPPVFGEYNWSLRQTDYFKSHKDSIILLMKNSISASRKIGLNYKLVTEMINGTELIPALILSYYADIKHHDILTVLMLLMKNNKYALFMNSPIYKMLYVSERSSYRTTIPFNLATEEAIIKFANDFYIELSK